MIRQRSWKVYGVMLFAVVASGCGRTTVRPNRDDRQVILARPDRILVYTFAVSAAEVSENQGLLGRVGRSLDTGTPDERGLETGRHVAEQMADDLVAGIRDLGLDAVRADRAVPVSPNTLLVTGQFLDVDEGNRLRRLVVGFGAGASKVDTRVQVLAPSGGGYRTVLDFTTHADSGRMPGGAVTMGAGAAAQGGVTAGMAAANVAVGGAKTYRSTLGTLAGQSADQTVAYLSQFFGKQGWIPLSKVRAAKTVD